MKIVHISYVANNDYVDPGRWLKRIDYFVMLLTAMAKYGEVINIHFIGHEGILIKEKVTYHFFKCGRLERWFPLRIHQYVKNLKPDVIIVHGLIFAFQVWQLHWYVGKHAKIVAQHHAEKPVKGFRKLFQKQVDPWILAYFFASKEFGNEWIRQRLIGSPNKITEVMEVPSVFYPMDRNQAKRETHTGSDPVYLWVGRLDKNKDPLIVARAFIEFLNAHPMAKLYMIFQSTELLFELNAVIQKAVIPHDSITLVGQVEHDALIHWYNSSDFIISSSHYEGSGIAICEGMSCGCIPVVTNIPSFRMMTNNGQIGIIYQSGRVDDLVSALSASVTIDVETERQKTLTWHENELSAQAIANKIHQRLSSL